MLNRIDYSFGIVTVGKFGFGEIDTKVTIMAVKVTLYFPLKRIEMKN